MSEINNQNELKKQTAVKRSKKKRRARKKKIYNTIIVFLCIVLFVCLFNIGSYFWQDFSNNDFNDDLAGEFISYGDSSDISSDGNNSDGGSGDGSAAGGKGGGSGSKKEIKVPESIDFVALKEKYKDSVGWIFSKNGVINYPIVQAKDNSYYLNRLPNGKKNINGSIFMDYRFSSNFKSANTIIYGHSMDNGSMFRTLLNYKKQSYYEKYPEMYIYTPNGRSKLLIFAAYETKGDDMVYNGVLNENGFNKFVAYAISKSKIKTKVEVGVGDKLVSLSTCAYSSKNARFIVVGKLVDDNGASDKSIGANYYLKPLS
ncbi:MAG: class B sortase [Clostridia bacterium]|nr:class B sortase [Clostridia bacterium]